MELLDRYLQAVKKYLPLRRQDDIIAELRANMESQLEDKESELGRSLTLGEQEDWLRQIGHPIMVAARYQPQQYLIGPAIFPVYWYVLRMTFLWATVIYSIVSAVLIALKTPSGTAVLEALLRIPVVLLSAAAWITAVFAAFEFISTHFPDKIPSPASLSAKWRPSSLPALEKPSAIGKRQRSYNQAVAEVVFGFLFLGWLMLVPQNPYLLFGPGAAYIQSAPFKLAPVWMGFFWWIVVLNVVQLLWRCIILWRGTWQQSRRLQDTAVKALGIIPLVLLISARDHVYILLKNPAADQIRYGTLADTINKNVYLGMSVVCAIATLSLAWELFQVLRDADRKHEAAR
jgi:hypothetical protein